MASVSYLMPLFAKRWPIITMCALNIMLVLGDTHTSYLRIYGKRGDVICFGDIYVYSEYTFGTNSANKQRTKEKIYNIRCHYKHARIAALCHCQLLTFEFVIGKFSIW